MNKQEWINDNYYILGEMYKIITSEIDCNSNFFNEFIDLIYEKTI
jgi:hypothetical protein